MVELITTSAALAQGLTYSDIARLVASGAWLKVLRGVYAPAGALPLPALRRRAALMRAGGDGWLCGVSALAEWGMVVGDPLVTHIAVTRTGALRGEPGRLVVHRRKVRAAWVERDGVRLERFDAAVVSAFVATRDDRDRQELLCRAVRERRTTVSRLRAAAGARGRFPGSRRFTAILGLVEIGCRSPIEIDYYLGVELAFSLPAGDRQKPMRRRRGGRLGSAYGDVLYRDLRILIELDGSDDHCDGNRRSDLRRDLDLAALGILTIRLTGRQVREEAAFTAARLLEIFADRRLLLGLTVAA